MPDFWLNPTSRNYSGAATNQAAQWTNLGQYMEVVGVYLAFQTDISGDIGHRYQKLPVILDDGFGAVFFHEIIQFTLSVSANSNYLLAETGKMLNKPFALGDTSTVNLNGYWGRLYSSSNAIVVSGETVDGSKFYMGTALRVRK